MLFVMAGGGTAGHVMPAIAVAQELRRQGHACLFLGTREGLESRLAPQAGFPLEWIPAAGFQRAGLRGRALAIARLPRAVARCLRLMRALRPAAVFSTGGYVAAAPVAAAALLRIPVVLMEPNAVPGLANRLAARAACKALVAFEETVRCFPPGRAEVCGVPVREAFFGLRWQPPQGTLRVLVTGGSRGARSLNRAVRECVPFLKEAGPAVEITLQAGAAEAAGLEREFAGSGAAIRVVAFLDDMPSAYAQAHLVVSRAGAGAVAELAAAGMPSVLVPFPYAADDHQLRNAEAMQRAGAAILMEERALNGRLLWETLLRLAADPGGLERMSRAARSLARPGAARRAAEALLEAARGAAKRELSLTQGGKA
jgi:UDP-N-acetylglucosamine--N-acetylmuramyl-(pentapeptide) pyrophosphoryl-undecaprenol N-acetylglucosamine transferase